MHSGVEAISTLLQSAQRKGLVKRLGAAPWAFWAPANAEVDAVPPKQYDRAADAVRRLYDGEPVQAAEVAEALGWSMGNTRDNLRRARMAGLVKRVRGKRGWLPVEANGAGKGKAKGRKRRRRR